MKEAVPQSTKLENKGPEDLRAEILEISRSGMGLADNVEDVARRNEFFSDSFPQKI